MALNYYQLVTLVEVEQKILNISGLATNAILFLFMVIILGQPILLRFKQLFKNLKHTYINYKDNMHVKPHTPKLKLKKVISRQQNPIRLQRIKLREQESQISFTHGMLSRGLTPIHNVGGGNCVFISLAQIVVGDTA
jgi:hypothetical protein